MELNPVLEEAVWTKKPNKTVRCNLDRFPSDFTFQHTIEEAECLRFQFGTLKRGQNINIKAASLPYA